MVTFLALINGVHYDPKKDTVKIQLVCTSHVSMDKLTSLGPSDESIQITLESLQTKITDVRDPFTLDEEAAVLLKDASEELKTLPEEPEKEEQMDPVEDEDPESGKTMDWDDRKEKEEEEE